jgi:hypothetical protein
VISPPFYGPFTQDGPLGAFNPFRDVSIYSDGSLQTVQSWAFDTTNNRYLIYLVQAIDPQSFVQVIHHVPNPPFEIFAFLGFPTLEDGETVIELEDGSGVIVLESQTPEIFYGTLDIVVFEDGFTEVELEDGSGVLELESSISELPDVPGFALVAQYIPTGDVVSPEMVLTPDPAFVAINNGVLTPDVVDLLWLTAGVAQVIITGSNGLNTGLMGPSGIYLLDLEFWAGWGQGWGLSWGGQGSGTILLTMTGYDAEGNPIVVNAGSPPTYLTVTATITIGTPSTYYLLQETGFRFELEDGSGDILLEVAT